VLTELNTVKLQRNGIEEREIEEMERLERLDAEIVQLQAQVAERKKVRDVAQAQLDERQAEIGTRLSELEAERDAAAADVPAAELDLFNDLAAQNDGEAMAMVQEIDRRHREYACGECNMHVPFEAVSTLAGQGNSIVRCSACGRILYMHDETRGALAKK
jgi:predicted  nucleic acid-binding Zn-ribbon protein